MATSLKLPNVIQPSKCILEDFEIIAFEREDELDFYSFWHDSFRGKSLDHLLQRPAPASPPQPRQSQHEPDKSQQNRPREPELSSSQKSNESVPTPPPTLVLPPTEAEMKLLREQRKHDFYSSHHPEKVIMKYKLTKLYNKFRGRQMRRNLVNERLKMKRLESEIDKGQLNVWLAYNALQALRVPDANVNQLSTIAINNNPKFITIPQVSTAGGDYKQSPLSSTTPSSSAKKKAGAKKSAPTPSPVQTAPMHYVYLDPNDIVTYSNRINPQQVIAYKKRSNVLPSSATSKKSSAASYDAFEIMEVLANSDNSNVTITRNANKPAPAGTSIYSHSINNNTKNLGIVSTQLHLQARAYLDSVAKFYSDEAIRLREEEEKLKNEPSIEEQIRKYIKIDDNL